MVLARVSSSRFEYQSSDAVSAMDVPSNATGRQNIGIKVGCCMHGWAGFCSLRDSDLLVSFGILLVYTHAETRRGVGFVFLSVTNKASVKILCWFTDLKSLTLY